MPWTAPRTWVAGEVLTAALMNQQVRDNELILGPHSHGASASGDGNTTLGPGLQGIIFEHRVAPGAPGASNVEVYGTTAATAPLRMVVGLDATARIVVDTTGAQTLSAKTLSLPVITDFTNATHGHLTAAGGGALSLPTVTRKIAAESVVNSAVLQNDDHFTFSIASSTGYVVDHHIPITSFNPTMDIQLAWSLPAGSNVQMQAVLHPGQAPSGVGFVTSTGFLSVFVASAAATCLLEIHSVIQSSALAGTAVLQWAQNTADLTALTFASGGYMIRTPL